MAPGFMTVLVEHRVGMDRILVCLETREADLSPTARL